MKSTKEKRVSIKESNGITLIALVVTVVVLVILSTISIYGILGENGLIAKAQRAQEIHGIGKENEENILDVYDKYIGNYLVEDKIENPDDSGEIKKGPNGKTLVTELKQIQSDIVYAEDKKGNPITIPGGFKVREDLGDTVQKGIVIEDGEQNQFVWIPVSNINGDKTNLITLDNDSQVEIILGRYTFDASTSVAKIKQKASEYASAITLNDEVGIGYQELSTSSGTNAIAKDLAGFVASVNRNHGYYIARYEASYGSGNSVGDWKPLSKISNANSMSVMTYNRETLWNFITQANAAQVSQNMYSGHPFVESDLINSYAWDTAIVYIQAMGNGKYALSNGASKTSLLNTGEAGDIKCNIYDMAGNLREWTTETNSSVSFWACISRGGQYNSSAYYTSYRDYQEVSHSKEDVGFRPVLYLIQSE